MNNINKNKLPLTLPKPHPLRGRVLALRNLSAKDNIGIDFHKAAVAVGFTILYKFLS